MGLEARTESAEQQKSEEAARVKSTSKELQEAQRHHRAEVQRLREELGGVRERWMAPEKAQEMEGTVRDLEG